MNHLKLSPEKLSIEAINDLVVSPTCGAVSLFVGTTRDNFEGKTVLHLEYEAHESMATKALEAICKEIRTKWPGVENIAIYHRLGTVPVKEASIVIAISSPHRADSISATQWCIDSVKETVPIWKKEVYADDTPKWKENIESKTYPPKIRYFKSNVIQEVKENHVPSHLIQINASADEIEQRIQKLMERKREEINSSNIRDFCKKSDSPCARVDAVLRKRKDSKGHLQINRVLNTYERDQHNLDFLLKYIPSNGVEERLDNVETQLSLSRPISKNIYKRLKAIEDRLLQLEALSPEYSRFWDKNLLAHNIIKKKTYTVDEIDGFIADLEKKRMVSQAV